MRSPLWHRHGMTERGPWDSDHGGPMGRASHAGTRARPWHQGYPQLAAPVPWHPRPAPAGLPPMPIHPSGTRPRGVDPSAGLPNILPTVPAVVSTSPGTPWGWWGAYDLSLGGWWGDPDIDGGLCWDRRSEQHTSQGQRPEAAPATQIVLHNALLIVSTGCFTPTAASGLCLTLHRGVAEVPLCNPFSTPFSRLACLNSPLLSGTIFLSSPAQSFSGAESVKVKFAKSTCSI